MTKYEELMAEYDDIISIEEKDMLNDGLYCDNIIWIKKGLTTAEKNSIIAEELGHYETTYGNILDLSILANLKREMVARKWAYEKAVPIDKLLDAIFNNIHEIYLLAEHFEVTEQFMIECLKHYKFLD